MMGSHGVDIIADLTEYRVSLRYLTNSFFVAS